MDTIKSFKELTAHLSAKGGRKCVAVVYGTTSSTQKAVCRAIKEGFITAVFVGGKSEIENVPEVKECGEYVCFEDAATPEEASQKAVQLVKEGKADVLMKGLVNTDVLLKAVLNKENGILPKGNVLTHITVAEIPTYDKLLFFTDPAVIPYPTQEQRVEQVKYVTKICHSFGIEEPKISLIHSSEKVQEKHFPFTAGYRTIAEDAAKGVYGKCIVDGPLDVKTSCCLASMKTKGIESPINGEADALIFPDIEAGNTFYKAITLFAKANTAAILQGPLAPVVLTSRSDSEDSKYCSLAFSAI